MSSRRHTPDPKKKEQDPAIIGVFADAEHPVLTTKEIAEELSHIGLKQTRRRLFDLVDHGIINTRKPARDRIWWLIEEVEEPITVRYPLLRIVWDRFEIQVMLFGAILGLLGAFGVMLFMGLEANNSTLPLISKGEILKYSLYTIGLGVSGLTGGLIALFIIYVGSRGYQRFTSFF